MCAVFKDVSLLPEGGQEETVIPDQRGEEEEDGKEGQKMPDYVIVGICIPDKLPQFRIHIDKQTGQTDKGQRHEGGEEKPERVFGLSEPEKRDDDEKQRDRGESDE